MSATFLGWFQHTISRISVRNRILLIGAVPLVGVITLSALSFLEKQRSVAEVHEIAMLAQLMPYTSQYIHELQRERGMSAGFITSKGKSFAADLTTQRAATDAAEQNFHKILDTVRGDANHKALVEELESAESHIAGVMAHRSAVTSLSSTVPEMAGKYTTLINELLHTITALLHISDEDLLTERLTAYEHILIAKEKAGLERATGTGILNRGELDRVGLEAMLKLSDFQDLLIEQAIEFATPSSRNLISEIDQSAASKQILEVREEIHDAPFVDKMPAMTGPEWFALTSERIEEIKAVEDVLGQEVLDTAALLEDQYSNELQATMFSAIGLTLASIFVSAVILLTVTAPLRRAIGYVEKVNDGDYDFEIVGQTRHDEFGSIFRALMKFQTNGKEVGEMNSKLEQASKDRAIARKAMMREINESLGSVVDAACAGDFSRRIDENMDNKDLLKLGQSVNKLMVNVEAGIAETASVLSALANTDLTQRMEGHYEGAFAHLKADTNRVADRFTEVVGQLRKTSGELKSATNEILEGANDLSERTTRQAATIEETSAAMESLAETVLDNAKEAGNASNIAVKVRDAAEEGGEVMAKANTAMERITESSGKISNIIGMIDDIAFQTNLLALNASVEAARAGEAGKGFAVVAIEVRRLAQSAAEASNDVKALVEQSVSEVGNGSQLVSQAATSLSSMLEAARENNELMVSIADKSKSQASAIEEINTAVREMDKTTQHNSALVEETNAAIEQTENQAKELDRIVDIFIVNGQQATRTASNKPVPRANSEVKAAPRRPAAPATSGANALAAEEDWQEF